MPSSKTDPFSDLRVGFRRLRTPTPGRLLRLAVLAGACVLIGSGLAMAEGESAIDSGDTAWILVSTALVLFMTIPGLALFYGGLVRSKNVLSVLMQCLALTAAMSIIWLAFGYSLAFDQTGMVEGVGGLRSFLGGFDRVFLAGVTASTEWGSIPEILFFAFQMTFAIITPALIVGAFPERMKFSSMLVFSSLWLILVYVPICHMTWGGSGGFFADMGVFDFAGGIVVHITAGIGALVACIMIGPRSGHGSTAMMPHNLTMTVMGTAMLWVGWFGFNGGSALTASGDAAMAITATHISACAAGLMWMAIEWVKHGKPSALGLATGAVAGLAAVTPASGFIGPLGGLVIGLVSGALCYVASTTMKNALGYDDSLDVFGVHGVGGIVGTLLVAFLASEKFGGNQGDLPMWSQFATQCIAAFITIIYTGVVTAVILKLVDAVIGLRVSESEERQGLDLALHEESGYRF
jgi:Amt family ammonium transporter